MAEATLTKTSQGQSQQGCKTQWGGGYRQAGCSEPRVLTQVIHQLTV